MSTTAAVALDLLRPLALARAAALATVLALALGGATLARADVAAKGPSGFVLRIENTVAAAPDEVFGRVLLIGKWWNSAHTYSGSAGNMRLENQPGGCFCERLDAGGFVR
ncbi:MAG TPA: hypothetical protein VGO53_13000, partial [Steroidobacteraceae bacterium]|nr:hypothetical protein [Steroidobacteraceae bacterium]